MRELIKTILNDIIRKIAPEFKGSVLVEIPENRSHGDYSTNVAFGLAGVMGGPPEEIAENLAGKVKSGEFSKVEAVGGFINFFLSEDCLRHQLEEILDKKRKYGRPDLPLRLWSFGKMGGPRAARVNVEFISANPTGPLTIGNGRGGFYGDVLTNILEFRGFVTEREFYINDRGVQVLNLGKSILNALGSSVYGDDENIYKGEYISDLAGKIGGNLSVGESGRKAVDLIMKKYIKPAVKKIGINFDTWFSERSLYESGRPARSGKSRPLYGEVMRKLMESGYMYEKEGATWLKTSELGDSEDRVLIKSDGTESYFLSDILYHFNKFEIRKFDKAIDVWGADHHGYAPRLKAALKALGIPEDKLEIVISQLVRLVKDGREAKVSKRSGNFVTLEELVDEVGVDAARFFFLMYSLNTHMDFDLALAKERSQKNPVYYVQYAHARINSILKKSKVKKNSLSFAGILKNGKNLKLLGKKEEMNLIRKLTEFPEVLMEISKNYEVHRLPRYALELAREFHDFYEKVRVIGEESDLTAARLDLIFAVKIVLGNTLNLMGISAPKKM